MNPKKIIMAGLVLLSVSAIFIHENSYAAETADSLCTKWAVSTLEFVKVGQLLSDKSAQALKASEVAAKKGDNSGSLRASGESIAYSNAINELTKLTNAALVQMSTACPALFLKK